MKWEDRVKVEQALIGAVLLEGNYALVADILRPQNFCKVPGKYDNRRIWEAIERLSVEMPLDILTLHAFLKREYNEGQLLPYLTSCLGKVSGSRHVRHWALLLVQWSILEAIWEELGNVARRVLDDTGNKVLVTVLEDMREGIWNPSTKIGDEQFRPLPDVFDVLDECLPYLKRHGIEEDYLSGLRQIVAGVDRRIMKMKQESRLAAAIQMLESVVMDSDNLTVYDLFSELKVAMGLPALPEHPSRNGYRTVRLNEPAKPPSIQVLKNQQTEIQLAADSPAQDEIPVPKPSQSRSLPLFGATPEGGLYGIQRTF